MNHSLLLQPKEPLSGLFAGILRLGLHSSSAIYCPVGTHISEGMAARLNAGVHSLQLSSQQRKSTFIAVREKPS